MGSVIGTDCLGGGGSTGLGLGIGAGAGIGTRTGIETRTGIGTMTGIGIVTRCEKTRRKITAGTRRGTRVVLIKNGIHLRAVFIANTGNGGKRKMVSRRGPGRFVIIIRFVTRQSRPRIRGLTSNSNYHEGPLKSTSRFPYRSGADRAEERADAARARTARFM